MKLLFQIKMKSTMTASFANVQLTFLKKMETFVYFYVDLKENFRA